MTVQAFEYGRARPGERLLVIVKLESPVGSHFEGVELESELRRVNFLVELSRTLRLGDGPPEGGEPLLHDFGDVVTHRPGAAVELGGGGGEKAAPAEYSAPHIAEPDVT